MMTTSEKATQKSTTLPRLSVHHTSFSWALCQELVLSTTHRLVAHNGATTIAPKLRGGTQRSVAVHGAQWPPKTA